MYYYSYGLNDYLCHYGVQGMKWGQHLMAKYETNRAGRALRRTLSSGGKGASAKRAQKTLAKYSGKYSKSQIADAAIRVGDRQRNAVNAASAIASGVNLGRGVLSAAGSAIIGAANPALLGVSAQAVSASVSSTIGTQVTINAIKKVGNTSISTVDNWVNQYRKM